MKNIITSILFMFVMILVVPSMVSAANNPFQVACDSIETGVTKPDQCIVSGDKDPISSADSEGLLAKVTKLVAIAAGVISVIAIIIGGIQYTLSSGDSTQINNAKNTILFAVIGLFIVASAQLILVFVINKL